MAKIDLEKFFNQLPLHPDDFGLLGANLSELFDHLGEDDWHYHSDLVSAFAQFGGSPFPAWANGLMSDVSATLRHRGIPNTFLTDDIFICGATEAECLARLEAAVAILRELGWRLQDEKLTLPAQVMTFLGVTIDTVQCRLYIPENKLDQYALSVQSLQQDHSSSQLHYKDLESLVGKLGWISEVMVAGRARIKSLSSCLYKGKHPHRGNPVITLSTQAVSDLSWWASYLADPNAAQLWVPFWTVGPPLFASTFSDASGDTGYSLVVDGSVFQGLWTEDVELASSGYKELVPVLLAVSLLGPEAQGRVVIISTDNVGNVFAINKGSSQSEASHHLLSRIFDIAARKQIYLIADWVPRDFNMFTDAVSKHAWAVHA
jgi:hypothetical protein